MSTWIGTLPETARSGHVAVVAQSGSVAEAFLSCGPRIGFRCIVSSGSEASRDVADLLAFLAEDEGTRAVGLFLEAVRRPAELAAALERCAEAETTVVCLKVGARRRPRGRRSPTPARSSARRARSRRSCAATA